MWVLAGTGTVLLRTRSSFFCALTYALSLSLSLSLSLTAPQLIVNKGQVWRLFTNFLFFGTFSLDFMFHMYFLVRYCRSLEEGSFRGRTGDFVWMILFGASCMTAIGEFQGGIGLDWIGLDWIGLDWIGLCVVCRVSSRHGARAQASSHPILASPHPRFRPFALLAAPLAGVHFLGSSLTFMMVYLWGRRNPYVRMTFLGLFPFT